MDSIEHLTMEPVLTYILLMVGMATISGVGAKLMVPGNNPHGTLPTFMIGFISSLVSSLILKYMYERFWEIEDFNPFQLFTIVLSIILGAIGLFIYRGVSDFFGKS